MKHSCKERAPRLTSSLNKDQNEIQRAKVTCLRLGEMVAQSGNIFGVILVCQILC